MVALLTINHPSGGFQRPLRDEEREAKWMRVTWDQSVVKLLGDTETGGCRMAQPLSEWRNHGTSPRSRWLIHSGELT